MPWKNEFAISIAVLHISGLLIYLELKIKLSLLRIIKKLVTIQWYLDIFSLIVFNPLKLQPSQHLSFSADQWWSITTVLNFLINFKATFHALLLCILICEIGCNKTWKNPISLVLTVSVILSNLSCKEKRTEK